MPNPFDRVLRLARSLLQWWLAEIGAFVPIAIRNKLSERKDLLVLALSDEDAVLTRHLSGNVRLLARTTANSEWGPADNDITSAIGDPELQRRIRRGTLPICVRLSAEKALTTRITLPLAVEENLRQVMDFELDRRTPFSSKDVNFAYRLIDRDESADQLCVELTVVARPVVAAALLRAERFGLKPTIVDVASDDVAGSGNLLPEDDIRPVRRPRVLLRRVACALLLALVGTALCRPVFLAHRTVGELNREILDAKRAATEAVRLRGEIAKLDDDERYLVDYKRKTPTVSEILSELTRALPDNTWLVQLTLTANEAKLSGFSTSASSLVQLIGQSSLFVEPRFRSAVVFDPGISRERFEMITTIIKRDTP